MKKFINKILDAPKLIKTLWLMLWIILVILLVMKFCFGIWYPVVVENEWFINMCNFIDNNKWLYYIMNCITYLISGNLICLTYIGKKYYSKWYIWLIMVSIIISIYFLKIKVDFIGIIFEIILIIICIIYNIKNNTFKNKFVNILLPIIYYGIINLYQLTLLLIRVNEEFVLTNLPSLMIIIIQIDYYIFLTITWIGVCFMGIASFGWFFGKDITTLKAEKEKELAKKEPDMELIEKIDSRIAELEKVEK